MTWYDRQLTQTLTRWTKSAAVSGWGVASSWTRTNDLACRWEDEKERFIDGPGRETFSSALAWLDADVSEGDYLFLGTSSASDPTAVSGAYLVRKFSSTPSTMNRTADAVTERKAYL